MMGVLERKSSCFKGCGINHDGFERKSAKY